MKFGNVALVASLSLSSISLGISAYMLLHPPRAPQYEVIGPEIRLHFEMLDDLSKDVGQIKQDLSHTNATAETALMTARESSAAAAGADASSQRAHAAADRARAKALEPCIIYGQC